MVEKRFIVLIIYYAESIDGSGYNEEYGLLGANKSTEDGVKLFPRNCQPIVDNIQTILKEKTGKNVEVMVYGDGAFKDPIGKIWELADPVVSPAYTSGLDGTPNEVKLKYLADNNFADLKVRSFKKQSLNTLRIKMRILLGQWKHKEQHLENLPI